MASLTQEEKEHITRSVMNLLDAWKIELSDQVVLLGFPEDTKPRALKQYSQGECFPDSEKILEHVKILLAIDDALHTQFPHHKGMVQMWMKTKCAYFKRRTPLEIILEKGTPGLYEVHRHLDCTQAWV